MSDFQEKWIEESSSLMDELENKLQSRIEAWNEALLNLFSVHKEKLATLGEKFLGELGDDDPEKLEFRDYLEEMANQKVSPLTVEGVSSMCLGESPADTSIEASPPGPAEPEEKAAELAPEAGQNAAGEDDGVKIKKLEKDLRNFESYALAKEAEVEDLKAQIAKLEGDAEINLTKKALTIIFENAGSDLLRLYSEIPAILKLAGADEERSNSSLEQIRKPIAGFLANFNVAPNEELRIGSKLKIKSAHLGQYEYSGTDFTPGETKIVQVTDFEWRHRGKIVRRMKVAEIKK
ncbi:MAG: hypothetical protein NUW37_12330 [Planctomycetes bacterium]|nr:hypothetical protein [Planctomycetota bacterium]